MSALLLDSSVWLAVRDRDDRFHEASAALLTSGSHQLAALDLTLYEVCNVAAVRWQSEEEAQVLTELVLTTTLGRLVRIDGQIAGSAVSVARTEGITVYDAAYVACARARGWRLVSGDLADLVSRGLASAPDGPALGSG